LKKYFHLYENSVPQPKIINLNNTTANEIRISRMLAFLILGDIKNY
jgi:hypothetical protein